MIYSGGVDVDILPTAAGKGNAVRWILQRLAEGGGAPSLGSLVCGDSGNDVELMELTLDGSLPCEVMGGSGCRV